MMRSLNGAQTAAIDAAVLDPLFDTFNEMEDDFAIEALKNTNDSLFKIRRQFCKLGKSHLYEKSIQAAKENIVARGIVEVLDMPIEQESDYTLALIRLSKVQQQSELFKNAYELNDYDPPGYTPPAEEHDLYDDNVQILRSVLIARLHFSLQSKDHKALTELQKKYQLFGFEADWKAIYQANNLVSPEPEKPVAIVEVDLEKLFNKLLPPTRSLNYTPKN